MIHMLSPNDRLMSRKATVDSLTLLAIARTSGAGCIEIALLLQDALPSTTSVNGSMDDTTPNDENPTDAEPDAPPSVVIRASNTNPTVGEQLTLTCDVEGQAPNGTRYSFSDPSGRLIQSQSNSTASLTISESDVSVEFQFNCSASFPDGTNSDSGTVSAIPSG